MKANSFISNSKKKVKVAIKLLSFILLISIMDQVIGFSANYLLWNKDNNGLIAVEMIKRTINYDPDIVILGSSRAKFHYNPQVMEKELGMSVFNLGIDGSNLYYHLNVLRILDKHIKPKYIVYDIAYDLSIDTYQKLDRQTSDLYPLVSSSKDFYKIEKISVLEPILLKMNFYKYNSVLGSIYRSALKPIKDDTINGFSYLANENNDLILEELNFPLNYDLDAYNLSEYVLELISYCQVNDIKLIFAVSPRYTPNNEQIPQVFQAYFAEHNIPLYVFNELDFNTNPKLFVDVEHINSEGADKFSTIFANELKEIISQDSTYKNASKE